MGKRILIVNGHPDAESFNFGLTEAYCSAAKESGAILDRIDIRDLKFSPNLRFGYRERTELESDLLEAVNKIQKADHLVWVFPMWWSGSPALMKGFIDRVFLPGIAFEYTEGKPFPRGLFKGKTARIIVTSDTPRWYDRFFMKSPAIRQFKKGTLQFCGVKKVKVTYIAPIRNSSETFREKQLKRIANLGKRNK